MPQGRKCAHPHDIGTACRVCARRRNAEWRERHKDEINERHRVAATERRRAEGKPLAGSAEYRQQIRNTLTRDVVSWWGIHTRLRTLRGPARDLTCVDCGGQALNWSLSWRRIPVETLLYATQGNLKGCPYSVRVEDYDPRCVRCAQRYDIGGIGRVGKIHSEKTHCPQGHPYSGENLRINSKDRRECRACLREKRRRFKERRRQEAVA